jgi:hypothetical protein
MRYTYSTEYSRVNHHETIYPQHFLLFTFTPNSGDYQLDLLVPKLATPKARPK